MPFAPDGTKDPWSSGLRASATLLVAFALAACGENNTSSERVGGIRDSAGVTIVESGSPAWTNGEGLAFDTMPIIEIASGTEDTSVVLALVGGILRIGPDLIAVVNGADRQVLVFDTTGNLRQRVARRGAGPGELSRPDAAVSCGEGHIVVNDVIRATMFDQQGQHLKEWPLVAGVTDGAVRFAGITSDCSAFLLYARPERLPAPQEAGVAPATLFWSTLPDGVRDTIGTFVARRTMRRTLGSGGDQAVSLLWTGETRWASKDSLTYVALGDAAEVHVYDRTSKLRRVIRWDAPKRTVARSDLDGYARAREKALKLAPVIAALLPTVAEYPVRPDQKPPHLGVVVDDSARLWLREFPDWTFGRPDLFDRDMPLYNPSDEPPAGELWQVFERDGTWLGAVRIPARLTVRSIYGNTVYGVWRDDDGAERVRAYSLKPR